MPNQLLEANTNIIAYQMEEYKNWDLVKIFSLFEHFSIQELRDIFTILCIYCLGRENHKINAVCFPSFHNGCNPACKVWCRLWTGELRKTSSFQIFRSEVKRWQLTNCPYRLCKNYITNLGFIKLVRYIVDCLFYLIADFSYLLL